MDDSTTNSKETEKIISKKKKKRMKDDDEYNSPTVINHDEYSESTIPKKKKKHKRDNEYNSPTAINHEEYSVNITPKKKKKHTKEFDEINSLIDLDECNENAIPKKKKKKKHQKDHDEYNSSIDLDECNENIVRKKNKKKKREKDHDENIFSAIIDELSPSKKIKIDITDEKNDIKGEILCDKKKKYDKHHGKLSSDAVISQNGQQNCAGRQQTLSIAVPASILQETCPKHGLQTYVVGQIARAACIYAVDEIIIYDDLSHIQPEIAKNYIEMMKMILEYQECPQYLRKDYFVFHKHLKDVGALPPLNAPHHLMAYEWCTYRDGIVKENSSGSCSYVDVGFQNTIAIDKKLKPGVRVTVKFPPEAAEMKRPYGKVVSPDEPRTAEGLYWGYTVHVADSFSEIFKSVKFQDGYDLIIGTSDKGKETSQLDLSEHKHALIVFGGVDGLEAAFQSDKNLCNAKPHETFHHYVNTCPRQQSRTIRTEEAILISLSVLSQKLQPMIFIK